MNKTISDKFNYWLQNATGDSDLSAELRKIRSNLKSAEESRDFKTVSAIESDLEDRFYRDLEFGTGGLRGVIGAGTNRMNIYTVARATQGLSDFVKSRNPSGGAVAIAYDSRHKSAYFARVAAQVLAANGIKCHIYNELTPTPMLSFAVRRLSCDAGIMITASHNPAKYNGYKAYGSDGCQLSLEDSEVVINRVNKTDMFGVKSLDFDEAYDSGLITRVDEKVVNEYFMEVKEQSLHPNICAGSGLKIVYTPLNGAGNKPVRRILREIGITDVAVVPEQENPDGSFPTCPYPNPEFREALEVGLKMCRSYDEANRPDLLLATDPDSDRVGIAVRDDGLSESYALFSGNEVGAMLLEYICRERTSQNIMPLNPVAVKSIVSTAIADKIAEKYGVEIIDTLTGFKFIAGIAGDLEKQGQISRYIYGFEESYGYLSGTYVRDKDAVCACMLICEMAAFYRKNGLSLLDARRLMYEEYGYYFHYTENIVFEGAAGMSRMNSIMNSVRKYYPKKIAGADVVKFYDYSERTITDVANPKNTPGTIDLPKSNVVKMVLSDESVIIMRPSGTEPKLKIYYTCIGATMEKSAALQRKIMGEIGTMIQRW